MFFIFLAFPRCAITIPRPFSSVLLLTVLSRHLARHFCRGGPRGGKAAEEQAMEQEVKGGIAEGGGERAAATRTKKDAQEVFFLQDIECKVTGVDGAVTENKGEGGFGKIRRRSIRAILCIKVGAISPFTC